MRTAADIKRDARPGAPFSNGTSGEIWMDDWCDRCANDSPEMVDRGDGCPLILIALSGETPIEWLPQESTQDYHCIEFRPDDDDGDDEPGPRRPPPEMPGQAELFPAEATHQGVRMFTDVVDDVRSTVGGAICR